MFEDAKWEIRRHKNQTTDNTTTKNTNNGRQSATQKIKDLVIWIPLKTWVLNSGDPEGYAVPAPDLPPIVQMTWT